MMQIIPAARGGRSFMDSLLGGAAEELKPAVHEYFSGLQQQKQLNEQQAFQMQMARERQAAELQKGMDVERLKQAGSRQKTQKEDLVDEESFNKIEEVFGNKFATIWKVAPVGGKTELLKQGLDAKLKKLDVNKILDNPDLHQEIGVDKSVIEQSKIPQMKNGKIPEDFQWPDFIEAPKGSSPKDWRDERKDWRKENSPVFLENKIRLNNDKKDALAIKRLEAINSKLPKGLGRLIINPETGEPYGLAQLVGKVPAEVQEFEKIRAQFQNRAKDAFGSRVTNFDLVSYMKQFPGLLNTEEGRRRIINMIRINNELDSLYNNALDKVYKKYGLSGVPMEKADEIAQSLIQQDIDRLTNEYAEIDDKNLMDDQSELSGRMIDVVGPDGQTYEIDEREAEQLPQGFRIA